MSEAHAAHPAHPHQHTPELTEGPDQWHTHTVDEHPQEAHAENIAHTQVLVFGLGGFLIIAVSVLATILYYNWYADNLMFERQEADSTLQDPALAVRKELLTDRFNKYSVEDAAARQLRIPMDKAMNRAEAKYAAGK